MDGVEVLFQVVILLSVTSKPGSPQNFWVGIGFLQKYAKITPTN